MVRRIFNKAGRVARAQSLRLINPPRRLAKDKLNLAQTRYRQSEKLQFYRQYPKLGKYYSRWQASIKHKTGPLELGLPWITFPVIDWLNGYLNKRSRVFEWGSGGSTVFLTSRAREIVSIEHDAKWYKDVKAKLKLDHVHNCDYRLVKPQTTPRKKQWDRIPGQYKTVDAQTIKNHFHDYCAQINEFPEAYFDLVIVDGRARSSCVYHAMTKVKPGGWILLDNSEREDYRPGIKALRGWKRKDFYGPVPALEAFNHTSLFQRPK